VSRLLTLPDSDLHGFVFEVEGQKALVVGNSPAPGYPAVRIFHVDGSHTDTCRSADVLRTLKYPAPVSAEAQPRQKESRAMPKPATKKAPDWKSLPRAQKRDFLLAHQTIADRMHTEEKRQEKESREDFLRRIYAA
jgi:hypothetical protein